MEFAYTPTDLKLLLYSINHTPELTGIGKFNGAMVRWLVARGHEVQVVTAPPYYPAWQVSSGYRNGFTSEVVDGARVLRCPLYVPARPGTITRLLHLCSFAASSLLGLWRCRRFRPDVVLMVEPTLFCAPAGLLAARWWGARAWLHVQDYELDAMVGLGLAGQTGGGLRGALVRAARAAEGSLMRRFCRVSSISRSMCKLAVAKGVPAERVVLFPNWVDTDAISPDAASRTRLRQRWGISPETRVVLYAGNMGRKQGLELVVQAAAQLRCRTEVLFVMVGQGAARDSLQAMAKSLGLVNMRFEPLQPPEDLPDLLAMADVHLVVQRKGAADVVLPSKLTGILAAGGHALITAEPHTELGLLCREHPGIATCVEPENLAALVAGLMALLATDTRAVNAVARAYAERCLGQEAVLGQFETELLQLVGTVAAPALRQCPRP